MDNPSDSQDELCQNESENQFSSEAQSDSGEEAWEESDESCTEECPELPSASASQDSVEENAIIQWLLMFLVRFQAKHYIPDAAVQRHHFNSKNVFLSTQYISVTPLLKAVELSSGKKMLRPYKVYRYHGLKNALQWLHLLPGFMDLCNKWRSDMCSEEGVMKDIYDGQIWKVLPR